MKQTDDDIPSLLDEFPLRQVCRKNRDNKIERKRDRHEPGQESEHEQETAHVFGRTSDVDVEPRIGNVKRIEERGGFIDVLKMSHAGNHRLVADIQADGQQKPGLNLIE